MATFVLSEIEIPTYSSLTLLWIDFTGSKITFQLFSFQLFSLEVQNSSMVEEIDF